MFGKKTKPHSSGGSGGSGSGVQASKPSLKDAIDRPDDDLPAWDPPEASDDKAKAADDGAEGTGAKETPSAPSPQPAVAQPVVANTAPNNPIAGITAPSRGSAQAGYRPMPRSEDQAAGPKATAPEPRRVAPRVAAEDGDGKQLIVGRDIRLAGEITACQKLVVQGTVEANLTDSETLEIAESGHFKGKARVHRAEIFGVFDGELEVTDHLILRNKGQLKGKVRYKEIEVERGGRLQCDIDELDDEAGISDTPAPSAAAVTASSGE